jgi:hypothetical protein
VRGNVNGLGKLGKHSNGYPLASVLAELTVAGNKLSLIVPLPASRGWYLL